MPRLLNIGLSLSPTWLTGNGWRRNDSRAEDIYSVAFYAPLARRAEAAKLDFVFRPDALFVRPDTINGSPGFGGLDPFVLLSALAVQTERIGLVTTASTTFCPPYIVARQIQSLNWISQGRAGWNVVTSLGGHRNFGDAPMPPSEDRYAQAREYTDVVRQLWRSYPHQALTLDRHAGRYAADELIKPINHRGPHLSVQGPLNIPEHFSGDIPLFQAGASTWGRDFAAQIADAVFAATPDIDASVELRSDLRRRAAQHGRHPASIRVLPGLSLYLGRTAHEARALHRETHDHPSRFAQLHQTIQTLLGVDLSNLPETQRVTPDLLPAESLPTRSQTHTDLLRRLIERDRPTVGELLARPEVAGSAHWIVIGTSDDAFRAITERVEAGGADGFIVLPGGSLQSLDLFFDELVPRLAEGGWFRHQYNGSTLKAHLGMQ